MLFAAIWFSRGRRWLVYFVLSMAMLDITGNINIKRVPFMLPWLFLAVGTAVSSRASRYPRLALSAITVIVVSGWIGIMSGKHYATANLYEPWGKVAEVVAQDARSGETIVSVNRHSFFISITSLVLNLTPKPLMRLTLGKISIALMGTPFCSRTTGRHGREISVARSCWSTGRGFWSKLRNRPL